MQSTNTDCLVIRRLLRAEKGSNTAVCKPKCITILSDEGGGNIAIYQRALSGEKTGDTLILEYNNNSFDPLTQLRVGFGEKLPEGIGIKEYLSNIGVPADEVERVLDVCELRKHLFYTCSQLSGTQARQLELLRVLYSEEKIVILNDPFQPFNGRWREYFAEKLLEDMQLKGRILVVLYLSFTPQSWVDSGILRETDVSKITRPEQKKEVQKAAESDGVNLSALDAATLERQAAATLRIPVPEPLRYAYAETVDFILAPMANLSGTFGRYGAVGVVLAMTFLIILGATIMLPKAKELAFMKQFFADARVETTDPKIESTNDHVTLAPEQKIELREKTDVEQVEAPSNAVPPDEANEAPKTEEVSPGEDALVEVAVVSSEGEASVSEVDPLAQPDPSTLVAVPQFLQGSATCQTENDQYNLWYWAEPVELAGEELVSQ